VDAPDEVATIGRRRDRQSVVWVVLVAGAVLFVLAALAASVISVDSRWTRLVGGLLAAGLLAMGIGSLLWPRKRPTPSVETPPAGVRVGALLTRLLIVAGATVLALAMLTRVQILHLQVDAGALRRGTLLLAAALAGTLAYAFYASFRHPNGRDPTPAQRGGQMALLALVLMIAPLIVWISIQIDPDQPVVLGLTLRDLPFFVLAGQVAAAAAVQAGCRLPPVLPTGAGGGVLNQGLRSRALVLPVLVSFALLFLVFLALLIFGIGVNGLLEAARSPLVLGTFVFLVAAFGLGIGLALMLARSEPTEQPLFKRKTEAKAHRENLILGVSIGGAIVLLVPAFLLFQGISVLGLAPAWWIHFLCLGILTGLGPYGFYMGAEQRRIRLLEERFPDFLRDVASSHKGGLPLPQSVAVAARGEYGPLTPEVRRMADQISWNVSFTEALERFSERVQTPLVQRAVSLILQADRSGGATTEVLLAAARDAREIKALEQERRLNMSLYSIVIYVTFLVFLFVTATLYAQFVPQLVASQKAAADQAASIGATNLGGISTAQIKIADFQLFYFTAALVQGIGDGIVAGLMGSGKVTYGLRHSFFMVLMSYVTFVFLLQ
jgi:flagellar protein FlaJ